MNNSALNKRTLKRLGLFSAVLLLAICALALFKDQLELEQLLLTIRGFGIWAPIGFIIIYACGTLMFFPGTAFSLSGGLIFGPLWGTLYNMLGALIGATLAFLITRFVAADWVKARTAGKLKQMISGVEREGWKFVAVVRLIPLLPFGLLNYSLGLTQIKLIPYVIASAIFMLPACFAYSYVGSLGEAAIKGELKEIITKFFIAIGLLVLLALTPWFVKKWRKNKESL